jgi:hypothetical protein
MANATATQTKKVLGVHTPGSNHWVGDGFPVRNLFPSNGLQQEVNPFLMLDYAGPKDRSTSPPAQNPVASSSTRTAASRPSPSPTRAPCSIATPPVTPESSIPATSSG